MKKWCGFNPLDFLMECNVPRATRHSLMEVRENEEQENGGENKEEDDLHRRSHRDSLRNTRRKGPQVQREVVTDAANALKLIIPSRIKKLKMAMKPLAYMLAPS